MKFSKTHSLKEISQSLIIVNILNADDFPVEGMEQGIT
jgi:hypothetical protein